MGNMRYQRTAQRITSAVNCRPLKDWSGRTWAARCRLAMGGFYPVSATSKSCNRTGLPTAEAQRLLTRRQWREGDVAALQAIAARLGLEVPLEGLGLPAGQG